MSKSNYGVTEKPRDFMWKILGKLASLADECCYTDYSRDCVNRIIAIIRARDFESYIAFCKCDVSLRKLGNIYMHSYIVGERTLKEIRVLRLLSIFQKYSFVENKFDPTATAFKKFMEAEARCKCYNESTQLFLKEEDSSSAYVDLFVSPLISRMRHIMRRVCGKLTLSQIIDQRRNGPGASLDCRGNDAVECVKLAAPFDVATPALTLIGSSLESSATIALESFENFETLNKRKRMQGSKCHGSYPSTSFMYFEDNRGSALQFVPKDAETHRTISIEPTLNVSLQLGLDKVLRKRIKKVLKLDVDTQERNQKLAKLGSIQRNLVTLDLEQASDSVSLALLNLLPVEWAEVFYRLRSHRWHSEEFGTAEFHKISSMGNGSTFILETLIFASMCWSVYVQLGIPWNENTVAIFGDDIIIHKDAYPWVRMMLSHLGFKLNAQKSFTSGPIRESCGHDYYNGHLISRFTVKKDLSNPLNNVVLHNSLFLFFKDYGFKNHICTDILLYIRKYLPKVYLNFGPITKDDKSSWLFANESPKKPFYSKDLQAWYYRIKRNEKYHPARLLKKKRFTAVHPLISDGELPFLQWTSQYYSVPYEDSEWLLNTVFHSQVAKTIGNSQLGSVLEIGSTSDILSSMFVVKNIDVVRQSTHLLPTYVSWG